MSEKEYRGFQKDEAKAFCMKAIDEIYDHDPTEYTLILHAAVDEIPTYSISYDGFAKPSVYKYSTD